jgi:GNAT superfamily N-acetyltransferase
MLTLPSSWVRIGNGSVPDNAAVDADIRFGASVHAQPGEQRATCVPASDPIIRPFEPHDRSALQHIRQAAFEPVFRSFREIVGAEIAAIAFIHADAEQAKLLDDICDDICAAGSGHHVLVVTVGEQIVGFVSFTIDIAKRTGEIGLNAVHPDHAGRGLGTWMYEYVMLRMKELGMALATVGTGGDPSHAPARRAYEKAGFGPALPSIWYYKLL